MRAPGQPCIFRQGIIRRESLNRPDFRHDPGAIHGTDPGDRRDGMGKGRQLPGNALVPRLALLLQAPNGFPMQDQAMMPGLRFRRLQPIRPVGQLVQGAGNIIGGFQGHAANGGDFRGQFGQGLLCHRVRRILGQHVFRCPAKDVRKERLLGRTLAITGPETEHWRQGPIFLLGDERGQLAAVAGQDWQRDVFRVRGWNRGEPPF